MLAELGLTAQDVSRAVVETVARLEHVRTGGEDEPAGDAQQVEQVEQDGASEA